MSASTLSVTARRQAAGRALTWLAAVSALAAAVSAVAGLPQAADASLVVETWRAYGLFLSAGLFILLALRPRLHAAVWGLAIVNKAALTITAAVYLLHGGIADAGTTVGWDGGLTVVLIAAFLMTRA